MSAIVSLPVGVLSDSDSIAAAEKSCENTIRQYLWTVSSWNFWVKAFDLCFGFRFSKRTQCLVLFKLFKQTLYDDEPQMSGALLES